MQLDADNLYFTSDTHFGHGAVIGYGRRPFGCIEEMDAQMIIEWNSVVPEDAHVFHLGDVSFHRAQKTYEILSQLNGRKHLVEGNHDRGLNQVTRSLFESIELLEEIKVEGTRIVLCHFPIESWHNMHYGAWHLHGHCHGSLPGFGRRLDVGMDNLKFYHPISYRAIEARMSKIQPQTRDYHQPRGEVDDFRN